jgi:3D (Asp-Asp-Asp) domain-containing protein
MCENKMLGAIPFDFPEPTPETKEEELNLWATHYHVYSAESDAAGQPLLDKAGSELGPKLTIRNFCLAAVEGTVRVAGSTDDGAVYNYAGRGTIAQVDCSHIVPSLPANVRAELGRTRWALARGPFGDGVNEMILVPYRTIAVDSTRISYKSVIYIPQARGKEVTLPSGTVARHDGYFFAADTGGAIKQNHIDVFGGITKKNPFPDFIKSNSADTFEAFLINDPKISVVLEKLHHRELTALS